MSALTGSILFDPTDADGASNVGAYVRAGSDGDLIASQTIALEEWLNVAAAMFDGSGNAISSTGGALDVNIASGSFVSASDYDEDTAHTSGDDGKFVLGVRVDDLSAVPATALADTELDYQGFILGPNGELKTAALAFDGAGNAIGSTSGSLDVNVTNSIDLDDDLADTAIVNEATAVGTTAVNTVTTPLANRKHLFLANHRSKLMYFGQVGVTTANGFPLEKGDKLAARIGPSVVTQVIGSSGSSGEDLRTLQLS